MSDAPRPSFDPDADQVQVDADVSSERPAISSEPHRHAALLDQDYRILLEAVSEYAVYRLTVDGVVSSWNRGAERNKGYSSTEAIGLHFSSFYTPEDQAAGEPARALHMARDSKVDTYGWRVRKDGSRFWAHVVIEAIRSPEGDILGFAKVTCDVTAQKLDRDLLVRNLDAALSNMSQGLCLFDPEERIVLSNQRMGEMFGLATADFAPGTLFADLLSSIVSRGGPTQDLYDGVTGTYDHHRRLITQPGGGTAVLKVGPDRVFAITHRSMADTSWVTTFADISERMKTENQIAHMALHDGLTELPNRLMFHQRLNEALRRVKRGETCAVLCLDLDRFKTVNDTLGHPVGDQLLVAIARKLKDLVRDTDTVARLGGDEFAIVLSNFRKTTDTTDLAGRLIRALNQPHDVGGHLVVTGVSIGIALAPDDGVDPDQLLKCADLALYRAKSGGRGRYCYFEPEMDALLQQRRLLELDLRTALPAREFELYYQPIVNIERDEVCGFEALLRWHSPRRGMVSPIDFIPLAEEIGLIVDIGRWVLETACREATLWPDHIKVAVNVSAVQFKDFLLVEAVESALMATGLQPSRLEIEITESIMIADSKHACDVLYRLKKMGLSISMDDFGTGYSSLGYLRSFPFDKIKIDKSFVQGLGDAADCTAIVQAVMGICGSLGIIATAEGVETKSQMDLLRSRNCHQAQGFLISRPCPASHIPDLLLGFAKEQGGVFHEAA